MILSPTRLKRLSPPVAKAVLCSQALPRWVSGQPSTLRGGLVMLHGQPPCSASPGPRSGSGSARPAFEDCRGWARAPLAPFLPCKGAGADVGGRQPPGTGSQPGRGQRGAGCGRDQGPWVPEGRCPELLACPDVSSLSSPSQTPRDPRGWVRGGSLCHVPSFTFMGVLCAVCHRHGWGTPDGMPSVRGPSSLFWSNGFLYKMSCRSSLPVLFWGGLLISLGPRIH